MKTERFLIAAIFIALALTFFACSNDGGSSDSGGDSSSSNLIAPSSSSITPSSSSITLSSNSSVESNSSSSVDGNSSSSSVSSSSEENISSSSSFSSSSSEKSIGSSSSFSSSSSEENISSSSSSTDISEECPSLDYATHFCDSRDGKIYRWIEIGTQTWMAENLNYNVNGSVCYDNDPANCAKYGRLYNWEIALTVCPPSWHLPTDEEWTTLTKYVGLTSATKLKATSGWNWAYGVPAGRDIYDFTALPGGYGDSDGSFNGVDGGGNWWSATEYDVSYALNRHMNSNGEDVYKLNYYKTRLTSVRCVQD